MKPTLHWKYADLAIQLLMLLPLIWIVYPERREYALICYFSTAAWQVFSCALTSGSGMQPVASSRRHYSGLMVCLLSIFTVCAIVFLIANAQDAGHNSPFFHAATFSGALLLIEAAVLIFLIPLMTVWYAIITVDEIRTLRNALQHRSEIHWKL